MTDQHPITPLSELVELWITEVWHEGTPVRVAASDLHIATQAARWGADAELEACCEHLKRIWAPSDTIDSLRAARRPKPPSLASMAIAQAYGIQLDLGTQITMLLVLMLTSKGIAGVPRASLVVVLATCAMFNIPPEGVALILPIDHFCDMFRSATNVVGNALATTVVSKWEGELDSAEAVS